MIKVAVVGGTGYTGVELLRLLLRHSNVDLCMITSRAEKGIAVADYFPNLRGACDLRFESPEVEKLAQCELVFFATPNGVAMKNAPALLNAGVKVIDLAADFRLKDVSEWQQWYGEPHACPEILAQAVYGLPEVNRVAIAGAQLVANPGCYPTAVQLGFLPLLEQGLIEPSSLIADCKSAVSGAGRKADVKTLMCETNENFYAYAVSGHRHLPEIVQGLQVASASDVGLTFVPHLTPMNRGIHATLYCKLKPDSFSNSQLTDFGADIHAVFEQRYHNEGFVDVLPVGGHPQTRSVTGVNTCRIGVFRPQGRDTVVILSVIDNLVKGAAGQAVQNMNIMFGWEEQTGLGDIAILP
ncbi:MAG: N-acetyl-gamma-glutamyl-phosphate reductase [Thiohalomonadales bacterium]